MNKKGMAINKAGELILMLAALFVLLYGLYAYVLHGGGDSIAELQKCGSLTLNAGVCRAQCDSSEEFDSGSIGCEGIDNRCCVPLDETDAIIPSAFGSSSKYEFTVNRITFSNIGDCQTIEDNIKIKCEPGKEHRVTATVLIENTGSESVDVTAIPLVMINGDTMKSGWPRDYTSGAPQAISSNGGTESLDVIIRISSTQAKDRSYWDIFGYAQCTTDNCKTADSQKRGVLAKSELPIKIEFTS